MPHTFAALLVHVVFSTKNRALDLSAELPGRVFPYMGGIVRELKGTALIVNGPAEGVPRPTEKTQAGMHRERPVGVRFPQLVR